MFLPRIGLTTAAALIAGGVAAAAAWLIVADGWAAHWKLLFIASVLAFGYLATKSVWISGRPSRPVRLISALGSLAAMAFGVLAIVLGSAIPGDAPAAVAAELAEDIATRFSPVLAFDESERFSPRDLELFRRHATVLSGAEVSGRADGPAFQAALADEESFLDLSPLSGRASWTTGSTSSCSTGCSTSSTTHSTTTRATGR